LNARLMLWRRTFNVALTQVSGSVTTCCSAALNKSVDAR
jgi:hypothetical protein